MFQLNGGNDTVLGQKRSNNKWYKQNKQSRKMNEMKVTFQLPEIQ
ncbi:hypothetical protein ACIQY5_03100 [Peribacillus frigoritolerans]